MYRRNIGSRVRTALADTRVVLLNGARQAGKSTLAQLVTQEHQGRYFTLDDDTLLSTARSDPAAIARSRDGLAVIDEVQKAPDLLRAIKLEVDRDQRPGRFLLTGSANIFLLPTLSESLAGRMEILTLQPLSQDELEGRIARFPDRLFDAERFGGVERSLDRLDVCRRIITGGYPEVLARESAERRAAWFRSYLSSILQRDIRDIANIEGLTEVPRLLGLLASRLAALMNVSEVSRASGIAQTTLRRYLTLLEAIFIFQPLSAWSTNAGKRFVKSPKIHFVDTGLAAYLSGNTDAEALATSSALGALLESFVVQELRKQLSWCRCGAALYHFRRSTGREVDAVLEVPGGRVVGIEVKASGSVAKRDFAGLEALAEDAGKQFVRGVVLYLGERAVPFAENLWALPLSELWSDAAPASAPAG